MQQVNPLPRARRSIRGPYRSKKQTPRQTRFYRKRQRNKSVPNLCSNSRETENPNEGIHDVVHDDPQPKLYSVSILTERSSSLTISSYISRHHLSKQAQEDLLLLLNLHVLPAAEHFPSSIYTFRKNSVVHDPGNVQQFCHYFCPNCHFALLDNQSNVCSNIACSTPFLEESIRPYFTTISIGDQLKNFFKRRNLYLILCYNELALLILHLIQ